jgi:hypothetical protein
MAARHGFRSTYSRGCRCAECREAWRVWAGPRVKAYRAKKRAEREAAGIVPTGRREGQQAEAGRLGGLAKAANRRAKGGAG